MLMSEDDELGVVRLITLHAMQMLNALSLTWAHHIISGERLAVFFIHCYIKKLNLRNFRSEYYVTSIQKVDLTVMKTNLRIFKCDEQGILVVEF